MAEKHAIKLSIPSQRLVVAPGQRLKVPIKLVNDGSKIRDCKIKAEGVPEAWISSLPEKFQVSPGNPLTIELFLAPPRTLQSKVEFYRLRIILILLDAPEEPISAEAGLMVGLLTVQDNLGILVASSNYSVSPGEILQIPFFLINLGDIPEQLELAIKGLASGWVSLSETQFSLASGERKRVLMSLHPPGGAESRAGRRGFSVQFTKQAAPELPLSLQCSLTVAAFAELNCELDPVNVFTGQSVQLQLRNLGNIPQTCKITLFAESPDIEFRAGQLLSVRIAPGERANVNYSATLRQERWFGGEITHPYRVEVRTSENKNLALTGLITDRSRIPSLSP